MDWSSSYVTYVTYVCTRVHLPCRAKRYRTATIWCDTGTTWERLEYLRSVPLLFLLLLLLLLLLSDQARRLTETHVRIMRMHVRTRPMSKVLQYCSTIRLFRSG